MARTQIDNSLLKSFSTTFPGIGRSRMINGEMRVDQLNGGNAVTFNGSSGDSVDCMNGQATGTGAFTLQQSTTTPPTGFTHFLRATCTTADASIAAGDIYFTHTRLEGNNVRDFLFGSASAKTVTVSFWVRSSLTGIYTGALSNLATRSYPFEYTISSANTWEFKTITISGDITGTWLTNTGIGAAIIWSLALGSTFQGTVNTWNAGDFYGTSNQVNFMSSNTSRTWDVTGVQIEIGAVATNFEYRLFSIELQLCQRYFEKTWDIGTAVGTNTSTGAIRLVAADRGGTVVSQSIKYAQRKRVTPTVTVYPDDGSPSGSMNWAAGNPGTSTERVTTVTSNNEYTFNVFGGTASATYASAELTVTGHWTANARL